MNSSSQILAALRSNLNGVSGGDLCNRLGISRAAVWSHIESLRANGFEIIASPHRGYQLLHEPDLLLADDIQSQIETEDLVGSKVIVIQETTSTNDEVARAAQQNQPEGLVVFAESQTKGRGRLGRKWDSPDGKGLWFSALLRPALAPSECTRLTAATAVALIRAIAKTSGITPSIKWPNDLLVNGKKVAGILTEMSAELDHVHYVIIGVGIDVNQTAADFTGELKEIATSLKVESGNEISRSNLAAAVLHELSRVYDQIQNGAFPKIAEEWAANCATLGNQVVIDAGARQFAGRAEALDETGALLLRTEHGRLERIMGGDVSIVK